MQDVDGFVTVLENIEECCGCGVCRNACIRECIEMIPDVEGFVYPHIDKNRCVECGVCLKVCPVLNRREIVNDDACAFLVRNRDKQLRLSSTSGGAFPAIASYILDRGGYVFGVEFDEKFHVRHSYIDSYDDIVRFNRSKYVQSDMGLMYRKVKEILEKDNFVLFTGTPCQCEGLFCYLKKDYDKLYTMDLFCKGVPSPKVWETYLGFHQARNSSGISQIRFREKTYGYGSATMHVVYNDGREYDEPYDVDPMLLFYNKELISRPSCYQCKFKGKSKRCDFTVGDYFYIAGAAPSMDDGAGVTVLCVNTLKGRKAFEAISRKLDVVALDYENDNVLNAGMMVNSPISNDRRNDFFRDLNDGMGMIALQRKYYPYTFKLKNKIKRFLRPILYKTGLLKRIKKYYRRRQYKSMQKT